MVLFQACYLGFFPQGTSEESRPHQPVDKAPRVVDVPPELSQKMGIPLSGENYPKGQPDLTHSRPPNY